MTTMNRATYLQGRWKFSEDKVNVKIIVRIWSLATTAAYNSNSIVSTSTSVRGTYTCFISYNSDTQTLTLLTSLLGLDTKFTFETSISFPGLLSLTFNTSLAVSWSGASLQDLFLSLSFPTIPKLSGLCCPLHCNR